MNKLIIIFTIFILFSAVQSGWLLTPKSNCGINLFTSQLAVSHNKCGSSTAFKFVNKVL